MIIEPKVYEKPSEGIHDLKISEFVEKKDVETEFGVRDRVQVIFEVLDEKSADGQNLQLFLNANQSLHKKSKLGIFLRDLGVDPDNKPVDTERISRTTVQGERQVGQV